MEDDRRLRAVDGVREPPATAPPLDRSRAVALGAVIDAVAEPLRLQVFRTIVAAGDRGLTADELPDDPEHAAAVREALDRLEAVGLVRLARVDGARRYVADPETKQRLSDALTPPRPVEPG